MRPDPVKAIFTEPSIYDDTPGLEHVRDIMTIKSDFGRRVSVGAVDHNSGDFVEFNQYNTSYYDFAQASLSSGSIPGVFPPQHFKGYILMDGGTVWDVNINSAINQCHDMGATNEEITIDIMVCGTLLPPSHETGTTVTNWQTARSISGFYANTNSIEAEMRSVPGATIRWYFQEWNDKCAINSLNFDGDATWCL